jgi:hypothetical protein
MSSFALDWVFIILKLRLRQVTEWHLEEMIKKVTIKIIFSFDLGFRGLLNKIIN